MLTSSKKTSRPILLIAILIVSGIPMTLVEIAHAERPDRHLESKTDKVSPLLKGKKHRADEMVTVIVTLDGSGSDRFNALIEQKSVHKRRVMENLHSFSLSLPFSMVDELASLREVLHVSSNEVVRSFGHVSLTTGADAGQAAALAAGRGVIDGSGVGIAILDSGIDLNHAQFAANGNGPRVVASVDFTGENRTDDPYGHGTFVAAAAAGGAGRLGRQHAPDPHRRAHGRRG